MISMVGTAASAATAQGLLAGGDGGADLTPCYGLAFRFEIELDDLKISDWASCSGLKVEYRSTAVPQNGNAAPTHLPMGLAYKPIVLKRAIDRVGSGKLAAWLNKHAWDWLDGKAVDPGSAVINLLGPDNKRVARWFLVHVRPVSWTGPELDGAGNKVAFETLELAHEGITMVTGDGKPAPPSDHLGSENTLELTAGADTITFRIEPTEVAVKLNTGGKISAPDPSDNSVMTTSATTAGVTEYSIKSALYLEAPPAGGAGSGLATIVDRLLSWGPKKASTAAGAVRQPTKVTLSCGKLFEKNKPVRITGVTVSYIRFDREMTPLLAKITTLTFEDWDPALEEKARSPITMGGQRPAGWSKGTSPGKGSGAVNPTSGGLPGRAAYTLVLGDALTTLAREVYGSAHRWRELAEANGIDDPRRLQPGRTLYLPAPVELGGPT